MQWQINESSDEHRVHLGPADVGIPCSQGDSPIAHTCSSIYFPGQNPMNDNHYSVAALLPQSRRVELCRSHPSISGRSVPYPVVTSTLRCSRPAEWRAAARGQDYGMSETSPVAHPFFLCLSSEPFRRKPDRFQTT